MYGKKPANKTLRKTQSNLSAMSSEPDGSDDNILSRDPELYYVSGKWYSFTICPSGQDETSASRWETVTGRIYECVLSAFANCAHFRYNVEISEPHDRIQHLRVPRIHAHGRFKLLDEECVRNFLLFGLYNLTQLGIVEVDTCSDLPEWDAYCKKQVSITRFKTVKNLLVQKKDMKPFNEPLKPVRPRTWDTWEPPAS